MRVLYFSQLKKITGKAEEEIRVREPICCEELWEGLLLEYPALAEHRSSVRLARNREYIDEEEDLLHDGDEVALIPPVSGG